MNSDCTVPERLFTVLFIVYQYPSNTNWQLSMQFQLVI
uniref:Uncharacterized protein n=1 Tax=Arundo donax TaxID=35708 RepID=A0A0A9H3I4_ARUDO